MAGYKTQLAATLFADVLKQAQEAKQAKSQVETSEVEHGREKEQVKADGAKGQTDWRNFEELKAKHSDAVLLFRCRDFYESYKEDGDRVRDSRGFVSQNGIGHLFAQAGTVGSKGRNLR